MFKVGDMALHKPSGRMVEITKVGVVTYGIYDSVADSWWTVPYDDVITIGEYVSKPPLTFEEFQRANAARCAENAGGENDWNITDWTNALAGETGELCNMAKKIRRALPQDPSFEDVKQDIAYELADIVTYIGVIAHRYDINLEEAIREKFNIVSERRNSSLRL